MFKILLVDDEPHVRQGIKMMIPWEELGCEVVAEADDGDSGLAKMLSLQPDIVIADIKMPGKTGIEMTEAAKALGFKGKVLILSGYSDFTYAKTAIALGVENFILKPVDEDELIEAIKTAIDKITREREHRYKQEIGREYLNEQLVKGLFSGNQEIVDTVIKKYEYSGYSTAIVYCDDDKDKSEICYSQVRKFFEPLSNVDIITIDISGVIGILFKGWSKSEARDALSKLYDTLNTKTFISCGDYVLSPAEIRQSYDTAEYIYRCRFIFGPYGLVTSDNIISSADTDETEYASKLYAYMEINDTEKMNGVIDSFSNSMQRYGNTPEKAKVSCITLVMNVRSNMVRSAADKKPESLITSEFIQMLEECGSLREMTDNIKRTFGSISDSCFGKTTKSTMERVVQYVRSNYNKELRLEILAGIFGYNSAYLGKVFHQYTGDNFNNYLDEIRITEAKRLLSEEEYKVYEVAEMVGYTNINYFHNKFKKNVGISPLAYKRQNGKNE